MHKYHVHTARVHVSAQPLAVHMAGQVLADEWVPVVPTGEGAAWSS